MHVGVVGGGAIGCAAAFVLARRGVEVEHCSGRSRSSVSTRSVGMVISPVS